MAILQKKYATGIIFYLTVSSSSLPECKAFVEKDSTSLAAATPFSSNRYQCHAVSEIRKASLCVVLNTSTECDMSV